MNRRAAVLFLATLIAVAGSLTSPASPAGATAVAPPDTTYFWVDGPTPNPLHTSCGEFGCVAEGNLWSSDDYFLPGPEGCTGYGSQRCQFYRNPASIILNQSVEPAIYVQLYYGNNPISAQIMIKYTLAPNAFTASYGGAYWEDGTDATAAVSFSTSYLVHAGTNPTLGECVPAQQAKPTDSVNPVNGADCITLTSGLGSFYGLPSWSPYEFIVAKINGSSTDPVRSLMPGLVPTGTISFTGGSVAHLQVVPQPSITGDWTPTAVSTTVGGTTNVHIQIPTNFAAATPVDYFLYIRMYTKPGETGLHPVDGTAAGMIARRGGTASDPLSYAHMWWLNSLTSTPTLDIPFEGVAPGTVYVVLDTSVYSGSYFGAAGTAKYPASSSHKVVALTVTNGTTPPPVVTPPVVTPVVAPPTAPGAPTITSIAAKKGGKVTVAYSVGSTGGRPITSGTARCTPVKKGKAKSGGAASGPILVKGLIKGQTYKCQVQVWNAVGVSGWSAVSKVKAK
ncbi:MAG: hypothetical protein WCP28_13170 [Actinomycetes bacterium]